MLRALLARIGARFERREADTEDETSTFVPSRLDASVLFAHGMSSKEGERQLVEIEDRAEALREQRREQ